MNTNTIRWFEMLTDTVAHYVDDSTSEVYSLTANAPHFVRVREEDQTVIATLLTNDRAELIAGEAKLTGLSDETVAAVVEAMLR